MLEANVMRTTLCLPFRLQAEGSLIKGVSVAFFVLPSLERRLARTGRESRIELGAVSVLVDGRLLLLGARSARAMQMAPSRAR